MGNKGEGNTFPEGGASSVQPTCKGAIPPTLSGRAKPQTCPCTAGKAKGLDTKMLQGKHKNKNCNGP